MYRTGGITDNSYMCRVVVLLSTKLLYIGPGYYSDASGHVNNLGI